MKKKRDYMIPLTLNTPTFLQHWELWVCYLQKRLRRMPTIHSLDLHLRDLEVIGPDRAVAAILHSMKCEYRCPYEQSTQVLFKEKKALPQFNPENA